MSTVAAPKNRRTRRGPGAAVSSCTQGVRAQTTKAASGRERTASLIAIGDELLSGRTVDTNSIYLARTLRELGVRLRFTITVPDDPRLIRDAVEFCRHRVSYVFTSGGLGPTHDDVTLKGIALAFKVPLVRHPELEQCLRSVFGSPLNKDQLKMAQVPQGATLHYYPGSKLPVISIKNIFLFPGIPKLFQQKLDAIKETLRSDPYFTEEILSTQTESDIAQLLRKALRLYPRIRIGSYPRWKDKKYKVKIVVESKDSASVEKASDFLHQGLHHMTSLKRR